MLHPITPCVTAGDSRKHSGVALRPRVSTNRYLNRLLLTLSCKPETCAKGLLPRQNGSGRDRTDDLSGKSRVLLPAELRSRAPDV
jgi:hypothetical protein